MFVYQRVISIGKVWKSGVDFWGALFSGKPPSWVYHKFSVNPNQPWGGPRARKNLWSCLGFLSAPKTRTELKRWNPTLPDAISYFQLENVLQLQKPLERSSHHQHSKWPCDFFGFSPCCDAWCRSTVPKYRFEKDVFKGAGGQTSARRKPCGDGNKIPAIYACYVWGWF